MPLLSVPLCCNTKLALKRPRGGETELQKHAIFAIKSTLLMVRTSRLLTDCLNFVF